MSKCILNTHQKLNTILFRYYLSRMKLEFGINTKVNAIVFGRYVCECKEMV